MGRVEQPVAAEVAIAEAGQIPQELPAAVVRRHHLLLEVLAVRIVTAGQHCLGDVPQRVSDVVDI